MRFVWASALGISLLLAPTITKAQVRDKPTTAIRTDTAIESTQTQGDMPAGPMEPTTTDDSSEGQAPMSSPADVAPYVEKTWPTILIFTGAGISVIGAIVGGAAYAAQLDYIESSHQHYRSAKSWGCWGGAQACAQYNADLDAADKANQVVTWVTLTSTLVGTGLFCIGVMGWYSSSVQVRVAPTVGGATFSAQF